MEKEKDIENILLRLEAIEEILNLNKKTWKELGMSCPDHYVFTLWCKNCIYQRMVNRSFGCLT